MPDRLPPMALLLGVAGLIPFFAAAISQFTPVPFVDQFGGARAILLTYGKIILSFMGGALWGFATARGNGLGLLISVLPALFAFLIVGTNPVLLALGFAALLPADLWFQKQGLAPAWWLRLRVPLSLGVIFALLSTTLA